MTKKSVTKKTERPGEQYMLRLPTGLRAKVAERASLNGRSVSSEIVDAIEKHLRNGSRVDEMWEFVQKYREAIGGIDDILRDIVDLKERMHEYDLRQSDPDQ